MGNNLIGEKAYKIKTTNENMMLGEGSYASVHKIERKDTKEIFAAKIFKIPFNDMSKMDSTGCERELEILKKAEHPFVIKYIEEFVYKKK